MPSQNEEEPIFFYIGQTLCSSSAIGCLINIIGFIFLKNLRNFTFEMIFYSSISSLITNISYQINFMSTSKNTNKSLCEIQGFLIIWFEHSQSFWSAIIAYTMYEKVTNFEKEESKISIKRRLTCLFIGYVLPLLLAILSSIFDLIGQSTYWCYVGKDKNTYMRKLTILTFYSIMWTLFFISFFLILKVKNFLNNLYINKDEKELIIRFTSRLKLFPLVQIICLVPCTISRCLEGIGISTSYHFDYLIMTFLFSQGILYGIIYCQNPIVKDKIKYFSKKWCCLKRKISEAIISSDSDGENNRDIRISQSFDSI